MSLQNGKAWKTDWQTRAVPASSLSLRRPQRPFPTACPFQGKWANRRSRPLPRCPRPERGSAAHVCPFLFILKDELLLSLSAVLALLFVFKSSYNFAPGFIANSIYLLPRVSAEILLSFPPLLWTHNRAVQGRDKEHEDNGQTDTGEDTPGRARGCPLWLWGETARLETQDWP